MFGTRAAAVCRELTKLHEEVVRRSVHELAERFSTEDAETRGEFVIVIEPPSANNRKTTSRRAARGALARVSVKDAVGEIVAATGLPAGRSINRASDDAAD